MSERKHRTVHPWKRTDIDRGYQRRVARAKERGEWTPPGTKPNARKVPA
jgi:hypothetical protein